MMTRRPTVVDLFAGVGGMSLGFEQAGFDIAAAVELDPIHAAVHHFNFPQTAMLASSVVGLDVRSILSHPVCSDTLRNGVDVVCGGAPCQGFSLIGQRMMADPRNMLVRQFVRLVAGLDAKYFVFENVKGLTIGNHRKFLQLLISEFEERGYQITQPWRVLNAKNYGVPQNRERLFFAGSQGRSAATTVPRGLYCR
jgi:DNA (cytosine-5)-methyltransferase 1